MEVIGAVVKERSRYRIEIGSETIRIPAALYRERPLEPGMEIDTEEYEHWLLLKQYRPALDYAVSLLAQRPHASGEIRQKLERMAYRPQTVEMVLYKLSSNGLLDDEEFAHRWAAARADRKLGAARIAGELRRKGIDRDTADEAIRAIPEDEQLQAAVSLAQKGFGKAKPGEDIRKTRQRVLAMLARRGYGYDLAHRAIGIAEQGGQDEL